MAPPHMNPSHVTKIKVQLKLAIARLRMVQKRDEALSKTNRRAMAQLLEQGKVESARIRVENIIRTDILTELHELLELYCELVLARAGLLDGAGPCDPGLEEAVKSLIYAAPKTEIKELATVRNLLAERFGKDFVLAATDNVGGGVSEKVVRKLQVTPPREDLVQGYLEEIAHAYGVAWPHRETPEFLESDEDEAEVEDDADEDGGDELSKSLCEQKALSEASSPPVDFAPKSPLTIVPPKMSTDNVHPKVTLNAQEIPAAKPKSKPKPKPASKAKPSVASSVAGAKKSDAGPGGQVPDISELERRFAALKR